MADKRMFARSVLISGIFPELSHGAQVLYIAMNMQADDDGFIGNFKQVARQFRCTGKHIRELIDAGLLYEFSTGPLVVVHWRVHNWKKMDRYTPTIFQEEYSQLVGKARMPYALPTFGGESAAQKRIEKNRIEKKRKEERRGEEKTAADQVGSAEDVSSSSSSDSDYEHMVLEAYQNHCAKLMACRYLDENIRKQIQCLQQKGWTAESLENAFRLAGESTFLQGENARGWKADLHWLTQEDNLQKVCAGKYESYKKKPPVIYGASGVLGDVEREEIARLLREG